jgi:hypothetical protein
MRGGDPPTFIQPNPNQALSPAYNAGWRVPFEFQCNAAEVLTEAHDLQANHAARWIHRGPGLAEHFNLVHAVEIFTRAKPDRVGRCLEHPGQSLNVIVD